MSPQLGDYDHPDKAAQADEDLARAVMKEPPLMSNPPDAAPLSEPEWMSGTLLPNTDDAPMEQVLHCVRLCAQSWVPEARLVGNIRAGDIRRACLEALATIATLTADKAALERRCANLQGAYKSASLPVEYMIPRLADEIKLRKAAEASLAVVVEALTKMADDHEAAEKERDATLTSTSMALAAMQSVFVEDLRKLLASIPTAAQDLLERVRKARTPGTIEICQQCNRHRGVNDEWWSTCGFPACPIKRTASKET